MKMKTHVKMCDRKIHGSLRVGESEDKGSTKGHEKNFRGDGYNHYLDFMVVSYVHTC